MIAGLLLRNYKNYKNIKFIPVCNSLDYKYSVYVGDNGVGKSAVLEALDTVFNDRDWNCTQGEKKNESYICPLLLIEKSKVDSKHENIATLISNFFWNIGKNNTSKEIISFIDFKDDNLQTYKQSHYLIMMGDKYEERKNAYFSSSFDNDVKDLIKNNNLDDKIIEFKNYIFELYNYIYIPIEDNPKDLLNLQNSTMQKLLNKDILDEIEKILKEKKDGNKTIVDGINESLSEFIDGINKEIIKIDSKYQFAHNKGHGFRKNLTPRDIREKIVEAYFPLRELKIGKQNIENLSSGEQRKAVLDVAISAIIANGEKDTDRDIILAIDEPEASLHISKCFHQFNLLEEVARKYNKQLLVTTHWYGFFPIAQNGVMHNVSSKNNNIVINSFDLFNYDKKKLPEIINVKSMHDLATSILLAMRTEEKKKWIVCEGITDKIYLEYIINNGENNVKILSMGGCNDVIKLFKLLYVSLSEKDEANAINDGEILFLIDTDKNRTSISKITLTKSNYKKCCICRLQIVDDEIKLIDATCEGETYAETVIEDCLNPKKYYEAIKECINNCDDDDIKDAIENVIYVEHSKTSMLKGDNACIAGNSYADIGAKKKISGFAQTRYNKKNIAEKYVEICSKDNSVEHKLYNAIKEKIDLE